jgi:hypothetical protein
MRLGGQRSPRVERRRMMEDEGRGGGIGLDLEVTDITILQVAGDAFVTFRTPFFDWRIERSSALAIGKALVLAAKNIEAVEPRALGEALVISPRVM